MATAVALQVVTTTRRSKINLTGLTMMATDLAAISATLILAVLLRQAFAGDFTLGLYLRLWPILGVFALAYAIFGLYPGVALSPAVELRATSYATSFVFLILGALTFMLRNPVAYSRLAFLGSWLAALVVVPVVRSAVRSAVARRPWWGYPVVVFGDAGSAEEVVSKLVRHPEVGMCPVAVFDNELGFGAQVHGVPVAGPIESAPAFAERTGVTRAIVATPDSHFAQLTSMLDAHGQTFSRVWIMAGFQGLSSVGVHTRDLSRVLALELHNSLLMKGPRLAKRLLDLALAGIAMLVLGPLFALIALLIKLESHGPVLYRHSRIGLGCERFRVWKFRSMCSNADAVLEKYLNAHPLLAEEWRRDHKLKNDPRITRVGRFLRKTSLDELPQLLNVLAGEMSLVGPRPIVDGEIEKYGDAFNLYRQVIPGVTGLWQVSGRNLTTYEERVELDTYYVRNWSPWLDLYLLARTVKVVVTGYGAY